ncbi:MAG: FecR domain-containing protein, partial [Gammaproteobacteria bacterium]|nr:FecR domain-containing protein [Gammaproteobacteria bacterium]
MQKSLALLAISGCWFLTFFVPGSVAAAETCAEPIAKIVSAQGDIRLNNTPAELDDPICPGDTILVGSRSRAAIILLDTNTVLRIDQKTALTVIADSQEEGSLLDLLEGGLNLLSPAPRSLEIRTPFVNAAVKGTEFSIRVEKDRTLITVFEGRVAATNDSGSLSLSSGQSAVVRAGEAPESRVVVRPRDAVQWALYYPTIGLDEKASLITREAADLLIVGRVDEATTLLDQAREENPNDAVAVALQAIIAVAQNRNEEAAQLALQAVAIDPDSSTAYTALSYVQQSRFDIGRALESAEQAVERGPNNAYAWARLAELQSANGDLKASLESARQAVAIDPALSRTQTVLGFVHLTRIEIDEAQAVFGNAIALNSEDPLPRLGLGLAKIRKGDLSGGTQEIEIAAGLDPNNSLIRSYLGKAYFEEKRDPLDGRQFAIAKELDPNDPTPWFYDAIRLQTINRPVEALQNLQKSIELNDNRAVFRSRLLLDQDLGARSASSGRIYRDLGFEQLALVEGWKSVSAAPSDYSGHRFLADTYSALPRHEIARVSELLQSQLLQPLNITPLQPQLAESNLFILSGAGPSDPA